MNLFLNWIVLFVPGPDCRLKEASNFTHIPKLTVKVLLKRVLRSTIKSLNETTHRYRAQEKQQFKPKLASSTGFSFTIHFKEWKYLILLFQIFLCFSQFDFKFSNEYALIIANNYTNFLNESKNWTRDCLNGKTKGEQVSVNW